MLYLFGKYIKTSKVEDIIMNGKSFKFSTQSLWEYISIITLMLECFIVYSMHVGRDVLTKRAKIRTLQLLFSDNGEIK